jgi:hypothetical protein
LRDIHNSWRVAGIEEKPTLRGMSKQHCECMDGDTQSAATADELILPNSAMARVENVTR